MRSHKRLSIYLAILFTIGVGITLLYISPPLSHASHTASGAWVEDPGITGCNHCHNVTITGGSSNGSNRMITYSSSNSSYSCGRRNSWSSTVNYMISKGAPSTTAATTYLDTCYCTTCSNPYPLGMSCIGETVPPTQPTNVAGTSDSSGTRISLTWTASTDNVGVTGYNIYRDYSATPVASSATPSYTDTGLTPQTTYTYEIEAYDFIGNRSVKSAAIQVATSSAPSDSVSPGTPQNVSAVTDNNGTSVFLRWDPSTDNIGAASYNIYRNGATSPLVSVNSTSYLDTGLTNFSAYSYEVEAMDAAGNPSAKSASVTVPLQAAQLEWSRSYNGSDTGYNQSTAMVVDAAGNAYVTGYSNDSVSGSDYVTLKYDSSGNQLWAVRYNGPGNSTDVASAITVDASGNVYVTGQSVGAVTGADYATIKYDSSGNQVWAARYDGPANSTDIPKAVALDGSGNVYVTGQSIGVGTDLDYATVKYDNAGNAVWVVRYDNNMAYPDYALALAVDGAGNVYVTGAIGSWMLNHDDTLLSHNDCYTIKYDTNGNQAWAALYRGPSYYSRNKISSDVCSAIEVDDLGNVYITGYSYGKSGSFNNRNDYVTIKYTSAGAQAWLAAYDGTDISPVNSYDNNDYPVDLALDAAGNVYVTGYSKGEGSAYDYATLKYNNSGVQQWVSRYNGTGNSEDIAAALAVDASGRVYVTGYSPGTGTLNDYATATYSSNGMFLGVSRYNGPVNNQDYARTLALDNLGSLYVTGWSTGTGSTDYVTLKYSVDTDNDVDGWFTPADCDDQDNTVYPSATEIPNDAIDQDCSGADLALESRLDQGTSGDQRFPWVDYNESTNEYLVLWQDKRSGNDDIYGSRMDRNGNKIGSDIAVSTASGHQQRVLVKSGGGGYLALWHDMRNQGTNGADIYGAWIAGDGTAGPEMAICACASDQWNPVAGYDPVSNTFLVVFLDARGSSNNQTGNVNDNFDLYGAVIPAGGSGSVTAFPVVSAINGQRGPQIGYDHGNAQYYMAWNDRRGGLSVGYDIYGSRVTTNGVLLDGSGVLLAGASGNQFRPMVTDRRPASGVSNHLVAWTDYRNGTQADVYGVYVDGSGLVVGSDIAISTNGSEQANVIGDVDWISATKKSLVGYITQGTASDYEIQNAWVDQAGAATGDYTIAGVSTGAADEQRSQVVSYATDGVNPYGFLAVWSDKRNGTDYDIYTIKIWP